MNALVEHGRNPVSKHQIQSEYRDEQADAGRDCRTRFARPNSHTQNINFPCSAATCRHGNLIRLIHTLAICMCDHTYIVCVCVFSSHSFWTSSSLDVIPAGVTQEKGRTGFFIHLSSAVRALIFLARRIQPFLSLVDREVVFYALLTI